MKTAAGNILTFCNCRSFSENYQLEINVVFKKANAANRPDGLPLTQQGINVRFVARYKSL